MVYLTAGQMDVRTAVLMVEQLVEKKVGQMDMTTVAMMVGPREARLDDLLAAKKVEM